MRIGIPQGKLPCAAFRIAAWAVVAALATATAGLAQEKPVTSEAAAGPQGLGGLQVSIDPATGKLRAPSPEEARAMTASLERIFRQSTQGLQAEQRSDGSLKLDLEGRFLSVSLGRRNPDGSVTTDCTNSLQHALKWLGAAPAPQPRPALERE